MSPGVADNPNPTEETPVSQDFEALMAEGLGASGRDDAQAAIAAFRSAAALQPDSALPHFLLGAEYAQSKRYEEAEAAYANAVLLAPGFETARYQLGLLQYTSGRAAMALVTWEPLAQLADGHPIRAFVLGFAALARDDFHAALAEFEAGMQANRENEPMNRDIALVVQAIRRKALAEPGAIAQAEDGAPTEGGTSDEGHVLLSAYRQQGRLH